MTVHPVNIFWFRRDLRLEDNAGLYHALHRLADGNPDPATGKCTSLSAAFPLEAVPAFVIHPEGAASVPKQTADTSAPR